MTRQTTRSSQPAWSPAELDGNPHQREDKAERVQHMFASIAHRYDLNNRLHSLWRDQAWRRTAVRLAGVAPGDRVLDVACGTGDLTEAFAKAGPAEVIGLDFTERMLDLARQKAAGARQEGRPLPRYVQGDALNLPFDDASFDIVSIAFGIRNVADPQAALREMHRVLRPGGRLVILEFGQPRSRALRWFNAIYCERIMPLTASLLAGDQSGAYYYLPRSVKTFLDEASMRQAMVDAGFKHVSARRLTFGICNAYRGVRREPPAAVAG